MKDKKSIIIEEALKLFANKGITATSIQEIATESGISKGAFYLHFKSKEELILAILDYFFNKIRESVQSFEDINLTPREKFIKQLEAFFSTVSEYQFFLIQSREQAIPLKNSIKERLFHVLMEIEMFFHDGLSALYGKKMEPYLWDLTFMLEGFFHSYMRVLFFQPQLFSITELSSFLLRRIDSIARDIINDKPLLTKELTEKLYQHSMAFCSNNVINIKAVLDQIRSEIDKLDNKEHLEISLEVIEEEMNKETPRTPVIQGMLSNFKEMPQFENAVRQLSSYFQIK